MDSIIALLSGESESRRGFFIAQFQSYLGTREGAGTKEQAAN
jgi:hypothetical protein